MHLLLKDTILPDILPRNEERNWKRRRESWSNAVVLVFVLKRPDFLRDQTLLLLEVQQSCGRRRGEWQSMRRCQKQTKKIIFFYQRKTFIKTFYQDVKFLWWNSPEVFFPWIFFLRKFFRRFFSMKFFWENLPKFFFHEFFEKILPRFFSMKILKKIRFPAHVPLIPRSTWHPFLAEIRWKKCHPFPGHMWCRQYSHQRPECVHFDQESSFGIAAVSEATAWIPRSNPWRKTLRSVMRPHGDRPEDSPDTARSAYCSPLHCHRWTENAAQFSNLPTQVVDRSGTPTMLEWSTKCNKTIHQSINQSNTSIHQSINGWIDQSINQTINQSFNQSINQLIDRSLKVQHDTYRNVQDSAPYSEHH